MNAKYSRLKIPHVFIFLSAIILFCAILTYIIPSGSFDRTSRTYGKITQSVVVPGSYKQMPKHISTRGIVLGERIEGKASPTSILDLLTSIPKGMQQSAVLIFFVFIIGAVFNVIHQTGAINSILFYLIDTFKRAPILLLFLIYMIIFSGSSFMGIIMEPIALIPVFLILCKELGYDRMFGLALVGLPVFIGWSTAVTNPFTVQIAQQLAELPLGSGIGLRILLYLTSATIGFLFLMRYGNRVKKDSNKSILKTEGFELPNAGQIVQTKLTKNHVLLLTVVVLCYAGVLYAVQTMGWSFIEMSGGFIGIMVLVVLISGMKGDDAMSAFVKGLELMIIPSLVIGVARAISVVLQEGMIIDTILHYASTGLSAMPTEIAGQGMLVFQTLLNFFIPSASGQALVSMPLMTPLADLLDISRQTAVLAFILGDGISNLIIPTNGVLMAMLGMASVSFEKWFRFILPIFLLMMAVAVVFMLIAITTGY